MELRTLQYFLAVAQEQNITKAANFLHITQPTLSRQLIQLEAELDTQLFIRGKRHLTLTPDGLILKRRAQEILSLVAKTENEIVRDEDDLSGEIAISCAECFTANAFLPKVIRSFQERYPQVNFYVASAPADTAKEGLEQGLLDFGLLLEPFDLENYNYIRSPFKERWGLLVHIDDPLAKRQSIKADELMAVPLIHTRRPIVQKEIGNWFKQHYSQLNFVATHNLLSSGISLVEHWVGNLITFEGAFAIYDKTKVKFIPFEPQLESTVVLAWKKDASLSPLLEHFITAFNDALKA